MEAESKNKRFQPKPMIDLLPELDGILSKEHIRTLTAVKRPRSTMVTSTAVKSFKPLTIAEMREEILAMRNPSPSRSAKPSTTNKKAWDSSVRVNKKTKSHTAEGPLKKTTVRKVLNFQQKPTAISSNPNTRVTVNPETPQFHKPAFIPKKSQQTQAKPAVRISGIYNMPETPLVQNKTVQNRMTLANKENIAATANSNVKPLVTPVMSKTFKAPSVPYTPIVNNTKFKVTNNENFIATPKTNTKTYVIPLLRKNPITPSISNTPLSNMSWESGNDTSFLEKEKEIQAIEDKVNKNRIEVSNKEVAEEPTLLENIAEESPTTSTPLIEYRSVQNDTDTTALYHENTTMYCDTSISKDNCNRDESVIVSLCELFNKATVTNPDQVKTELSDLLGVEKQLEHDIKMVDNGIKTLTNIKESALKTLQYVKKLKTEKFPHWKPDNENNNLLVKAKSMPKLTQNKASNEISPVSGRSSSKEKSPSYKIPKKNSCLRKKILYKSMPNVSNDMCSTPNKDMDKRAFNMYMGMKKMKQMSFLSTPQKTTQRAEVPDTPAVTSRNLQIQLDKIFKDNT